MRDEFTSVARELLAVVSELPKLLEGKILSIHENGLTAHNRDINLRQGIPPQDADEADIIFFAPQNISADDIRGMAGYKVLHEIAASPEVDVKVVLRECFAEPSQRGFDRSAKELKTLIYVVPSKPYSASVK